MKLKCIAHFTLNMTTGISYNYYQSLSENVIFVIEIFRIAFRNEYVIPNFLSLFFCYRKTQEKINIADICLMRDDGVSFYSS